jgi:hypothetical protein
MLLKIHSLLIIIFSLSFPLTVLAQEIDGSAADLENISSPRGLEEIIPQTNTNREEKNTIYQIQKRPTNPEQLTENSDSENIEYIDYDSEDNELFRIRL